MRHHLNKECTTAKRSTYQRTQAGGSLDTYQTSLHAQRKTMRPVFIWYFHSNAAILCLKRNKMRHHLNKECTTAKRSTYQRTQAGDSLDTYQTSLHGQRKTIKPVFIGYFQSNAAILYLKSNKMRHHLNKECTMAKRSTYQRTQAGGSLVTYETSLH